MGKNDLGTLFSSNRVLIWKICFLGLLSIDNPTGFLDWETLILYFKHLTDI